METFTNMLPSIEFTSPFFLILFLGIFYVLIFRARIFRGRFKNNARGFKTSAFHENSKIGFKRAFSARITRFSLIFFMVTMVAVLISGPILTTKKSEGDGSEKVQNLRTVEIVFDISGSMGTGHLAGEKLTRFDAARNTLIDFLQSQNDLRVGIIFYSSVPFEYRVPTGNLEVLIEDLQQLSLSTSYTNKSVNQQFKTLSRGTETAAALLFARDVVGSLSIENTKSRAVILITDLLDDEDQVVAAARELVESDIHIFVLSITADGGYGNSNKNDKTKSSKIATALQSIPGVDVFSIGSDEDLAFAYDRILEIERERTIFLEPTVNKTSIVKEISLLIFIGSVLGIILTEVFAQRVRGG